jgi:hypothetical protein
MNLRRMIGSREMSRQRPSRRRRSALCKAAIVSAAVLASAALMVGCEDEPEVYNVYDYDELIRLMKAPSIATL